MSLFGIYLTSRGLHEYFWISFIFPSHCLFLLHKFKSFPKVYSGKAPAFSTSLRIFAKIKNKPKVRSVEFERAKKNSGLFLFT